MITQELVTAVIDERAREAARLEHERRAASELRRTGSPRAGPSGPRLLSFVRRFATASAR